MVPDVLYSVGGVGGNMENAGGIMVSRATLISNLLIYVGVVLTFSTFLLEGRHRWRDWIYALITLVGILALGLGYIIRCAFVWGIV